MSTMNTAQPNAQHKVPAADAGPGDTFTFTTDETGERFAGTILARELDLVQVQWDDGHESWTPLTVEKGKVEVKHHGNEKFSST